MIDNPTDAAAPDLDVYPEKPLSPVAPAPTMSWAEAESRKAEYFGNREWVNKYMSGDVEARAQYDAVVQALAYGKVPEPAAPDSVDGLIEWAYSIVPELSEAHIAEIRNRQPVSPAIRRRAEQWKEVHFRDPVFVAAYFDNDPEIRRQIFHLNTVLSLPVRDQS
jgi:hypothetical protein